MKQELLFEQERAQRLLRMPKQLDELMQRLASSWNSPINTTYLTVLKQWAYMKQLEQNKEINKLFMAKKSIKDIQDKQTAEVIQELTDSFEKNIQQQEVIKGIIEEIIFTLDQ